MSISSLTREMIMEYESIIGRKLTPQEYLQFRDQAMREIQNGFVEEKATVQAVTTVSESYTQMTPVIPVTPIVVSETPVTTVTSVTKEIEPEVKQVTNSTVPKVEKPKMKPKTEPIDPFFALIDKMDA